MSLRANPVAAARHAPAWRLIAVLAAVLMLAACGKKGPLYLPGESAAPSAPAGKQ